MEKIYGMHKMVGLQLFWSRTPTFSSGTPTFCQMGVRNSCFQNPSESSGANGSWDSLFPISMSPTADLRVQNTIFNDKYATLLHPGTR